MDQLYIEDTLIDLPPGFRFAVTINKIKIDDLTTRSVDFTNTVKLQWTPTNQVTLGFAWNARTASRIPYTRLRARLVQDGQETIADGRCWIQGADDSGVTLGVYENSINVFDNIEGRKLDELGHIAISAWNAAGIDSARLNTSGLIAAVLNWGRAGAIYQLDYFLPCFYYHSIVTAALELTGLELSGDILTQDKFTDLVIPYSRPAFEYPVGQNESYKISGESGNAASIATDGATNFPFDVAINLGDTNLWQDLGDELEVIDTGRGATRWLTMDFTAVAGTIGITTWAPGDVLTVIMEIYHPVHGYSYTFTFTADEAIYGASPVSAGLFPGGFPTASQTQLVTIGDGARIRVRVDGATTPTGIVIAISSTTTSFSTAVITTIDRTAVNWSALVPDLLMKDVIRDFTVRFGVVYKQVGGTLYMKTIEEIARDRGRAVNWSSKRVRTSKQSISYKTEYAQRNVMNYQNEAQDPELGAGTFTLDNDTLPDRKVLYTSPFGNAKTATYSSGKKALVNVYEGATGGITDFQNEPGLRLLMLRDKDPGEASITFNASARSDYRVAYFVDPDQAKDAGFQFFLDEQYGSLAESLDETKTLVNYYDLDQGDIANFDQFLPVWDEVDGAYFVVVKIYAFMPGQVTKVELFKLK